jgi:hypothetical protein
MWLVPRRSLVPDRTKVSRDGLMALGGPAAAQAPMSRPCHPETAQKTRKKVFL